MVDTTVVLEVLWEAVPKLDRNPSPVTKVVMEDIMVVPEALWEVAPKLARSPSPAVKAVTVDTMEAHLEAVLRQARSPSLAAKVAMEVMEPLAVDHKLVLNPSAVVNKVTVDIMEVMVLVEADPRLDRNLSAVVSKATEVTMVDNLRSRAATRPNTTSRVTDSVSA